MADPRGEITKKFIDLITPETSYLGLVKLVNQFLSPDDRQILGGGETALKKVADSIAYLGVFAPYPATFDKSAFLEIAAFELPTVEQERLWKINKRLELLKDESPVGKDRVSISTELVTIAKNQFFTE